LKSVSFTFWWMMSECGEAVRRKQLKAPRTSDAFSSIRRSPLSPATFSSLVRRHSCSHHPSRCDPLIQPMPTRAPCQRPCPRLVRGAPPALQVCATRRALRHFHAGCSRSRTSSFTTRRAARQLLRVRPPGGRPEGV
jgi:hypothetical protein